MLSIQVQAKLSLNIGVGEQLIKLLLKIERI